MLLAVGRGNSVLVYLVHQLKANTQSRLGIHTTQLGVIWIIITIITSRFYLIVNSYRISVLLPSSGNSIRLLYKSSV